MSALAILGGKPVFDKAFEPYNSIGSEEINAVTAVMKTGCLSKFLGAFSEDFYGGPLVRQFEENWSKKFGIKHSVSVNSATAGLTAALGAIGIGPGDEVIVPPYTMSATAVAPLMYGGIPVFADIEADTFCIDPQSVKQNITSKTKAIIAVNLFGHPAKLQELRVLADQHKIKLVEDNAQAPLASENGRLTGTIGHIGVFSLNYHKHIHTGEGGVCVTDDDDLALRMKLIRNHGENVTENLQIENIANLVGYNYRLTEIGAAIGIEQLKKIDLHLTAREKVAKIITEGTAGLDGLTPPLTREWCRHVYYLWAMRFDHKAIGISRATFMDALKAEGVPFSAGYVRPLYLLPLFQQKIATGSAGFPFTLSNRQYARGLCPVVERMHYEELLGFVLCTYNLNEHMAEQIVAAIRKVHSHAADLRKLEESRKISIAAGSGTK